MMANLVERSKRTWSNPRQRWAGVAVLAWLPILAAIPALLLSEPVAKRSAGGNTDPAPRVEAQRVTAPVEHSEWQTGTMGGLRLSNADNPFGESWPRFNWKNYRGGGSNARQNTARQWAPPARLGVSPAMLGYGMGDGRKSKSLRQSARNNGQAVAGQQTTYRTFCVRLCDGFLTPISFATTRDRLRQDAKTCETTCGSPARMFYHANPGSEQEDMVDLAGNRYDALDTAYLYRSKYIHSCQCQPLPWSAEAQFRHANYAAAEAKLAKRSQRASGQGRWTKADRRAVRDKLRDVAAVGLPISKADAERSTVAAIQPTKNAAEPEVWSIGGRRGQLAAIVPPAPRRTIIAAEARSAGSNRNGSDGSAGQGYRPIMGAAVFTPAVLAAGAFQSIPWEFISAQAVPTAHHITMPTAVAY